MRSGKVGELARFNMPFELGLDLGLRHGGKRMKEKKCLVLDEEAYRYQAAISDFSGSDIASYGKTNQISGIFRAVRDWLTHVLHPKQPPFNKIYFEFSEFISDLQLVLKSEGFSLNSIDSLTTTEFTFFAKEWIKNRPLRKV